MVPGGDIAANRLSPFFDKTLRAEFEATDDVEVEMVGLDYDPMQRKIFAAGAGKNITDVLRVDVSWLPSFPEEEMLEPAADATAKAWLSAHSRSAAGDGHRGRRHPESPARRGEG